MGCAENISKTAGLTDSLLQFCVPEGGTAKVKNSQFLGDKTLSFILVIYMFAQSYDAILLSTQLKEMQKSVCVRKPLDEQRDRVSKAAFFPLNFKID